MGFRTKPTVIAIERFSDIGVSRAEDARDRAQAQLATDTPDLNRPRAEATLARAQNRIKVAINS